MKLHELENDLRGGRWAHQTSNPSVHYTISSSGVLIRNSPKSYGRGCLEAEAFADDWTLVPEPSKQHIDWCWRDFSPDHWDKLTAEVAAQKSAFERGYRRGWEARERNFYVDKEVADAGQE